MGERSFFAELKRRNVLRMAGLYLVAAWLIVQVTSTVLPMFDAPAWLPRTIVVALAVGFVPAILFSWVFAWTPDGLRRDADVAPGASLAPQTGRRMDRAIIAVLALALACFGFDRFVLAPRRDAALIAQATAHAAPAAAAKPAGAPRSIAVLPFANLSADKDNAFFSDGLSEEILNSLSRIDGLQVVARTSSFQFKGKDLDARTVGARLGVANILEGSVRREGDRVRVSAQLIRASDGIQLWSQSYDRTVTDSLAVQLDIAGQVAGVLDVVLDDKRRARMAQDGVRNVDAFIAYQKGLKLYEDAHDVALSRDAIEGLRLANVAFERAAELEPGFAQAYFTEADLYDHILLSDGRSGAERLDAQRQAMRLYGLVAEHSHDGQLHQLALVERQMVSDDWHGLAASLQAALNHPGCRNPDWLPVFASAFGFADSIEDLGKRVTACDPLNRINYNNRTRSALAASRGRQALDIITAYERSRGGVPMHSVMRVEALLVMGDVDEAKAELAGIELHDEGYSKAEAMFAAATGATVASLRAGRAPIDRSRSIYDFWDNADAVAAAWSGNRAEANRRAAEVDARPAGPFQLAVLTSDCLCGAPFDLDATPNFKARLAESGLHWPPQPAIRLPHRADGTAR